MNDSTFSRKLKSLAIANSKYKKLLMQCENEYKRRFGHYPGDVYNDSWIDTFHIGSGFMTVSEVAESDELYCKPMDLF